MAWFRNGPGWLLLGAFGFLAVTGPANADPAPTKNPRGRGPSAGEHSPARLVAEMGGGPFRHPGPVYAVALSAKGDRLATACRDTSLRVWSVPDGRLVFAVPANDHLQCLAFSREGKLLAAGGVGSVRLWHADTGNLAAELPGDPRQVKRLAFSADDKTLLSANGDGSLRVWDVATGKELRRFQPKPDFRVDAADLTPDGKTLALASSHDKKVRLWDVTTGKERFTLEGCEVSEQRYLAFSPDSGMVAVVLREKAAPAGLVVRIHEVATGKQHIQLPRLGTGVTCMAFAPAGDTLLVGGGNETVQLWAVAPGKEPRQLRSLPGSAAVAAFSGDGKALAFTNRADLTVRLWDLTTGKAVGLRRGHEGAIRAAAFSPNGKVLVTAGEDDTIRLWDAETGKELEAFPGRAPVAFSPDGKLLAHATAEWVGGSALRVWDLAARAERHRLHLAAASVTHLAFSPDSKVLFSGWQDGRIRVWEVATGRLLRALQLPGRDQVTALALSPDGKVLATGAVELGEEKPTPSMEQTIRVWNAVTGKRLLNLRGPMSYPFKPVFPGFQLPVMALTFSPDGKFLVSTHMGREGPVRLWEAASGQEVQPLPSVTGAGLSGLAFSPVGKVLATGNYSGDAQREDQAIHLWDTGTWQELHQLKGHSGGVCTLAFSADGKRLAAGTPAGTALVWDMSRLRAPQPKAPDLEPRQWAELWADLAERDASRARRASQTLISSACPGSSLTWITASSTFAKQPPRS